MAIIRPFNLCAAISSLMVMSACGKNLHSDVYSSESSVGKVLYGTVVSARSITIKDNESNKQLGLGTIAGGAAGGVAGSTIGKGRGSTLGAIGGALAGAVVGAIAEDQLSTSEGIEYIVQLDASKTPKSIAIKKHEKLTVNNGKNVEADVIDAAMIEETSSNVISVIQQDDAPIAAGARVMVVYRDDRARITAVR